VPTRNKRAIIGWVATAIVAASMVLLFYGWQIRREASSLLNDLTTLRVGRSTSDDAERVVQRHQRFLDRRDCQKNICQYSFSITNHWLSSLHAEPETKFWAGITVDNGTVTRIAASLLRSMNISPTFPASAGGVEEFAEMPQRLAKEGHYVFPTPIGKPYLHVVLDRYATDTQRQHGFAFSFQCFTKPGGGCDLPCDYLPLAWRDWEANLQKTGHSKGDFDRAYPSNQRCK
jgi:hypothetical protein